MIVVLTLALLGSARAGELGFTEVTRLALGDGAAARIVASEANAAAADARQDAAWAGNPELGLEVRPGETTATLAVPVDWGVVARGNAAGDATAAARVREQAGRAAVASAAGAAYLDAVRARELAALASEAQALATRQRVAADASLAAGELAPAEHVLLVADAAGALDDALSLARDAAVAARRLGVLVGRAEPGPLGGWPTLATPADPDPAKLPAVLAADLDARAALKRLHATSLSRIPALTVSAGWVVGGSPGPVYGASLELPLFAPGGARQDAARAERETGDATAQLARLDAAATLADARAELDVATQVATAWAIPGLDVALEAASRRYTAGESTLVAYVAERDLALGALQSAVDARWRLERARLALWELAGEVPVETTP